MADKNIVRFGGDADFDDLNKDFKELEESKKTVARPVKANIEIRLQTTSVVDQLKRVRQAFKEAEQQMRAYALETAKAYALLGGQFTSATAAIKRVGANTVVVEGQRRLPGGASIPYTTSVDVTPQRERLRSLERQRERLRLQRAIEREGSTPRIHPATLLSQSVATVPIKYVTLVSDISSALRAMVRSNQNLEKVFADPRNALNTNQGSRRAVTAAITDPRALPPAKLEELRALGSIGKQAIAIQTVITRLAQGGAKQAAPIGIAVNERNLNRIERMIQTYNRLVGRLSNVYKTPGVTLPTGEALRGQSIRQLAQTLAGDVLVQVSNAFEAVLAGTALRSAVFAGLLKPTRGFAGITREQAETYLSTASSRPVFASGLGIGGGNIGDWQKWAYGLLQRVSSAYKIVTDRAESRRLQDDARVRALERLGARQPLLAPVQTGIGPTERLPGPLPAGEPRLLGPARQGPGPGSSRPTVSSALVLSRRRSVAALEADLAAREQAAIQSRFTFARSTGITQYEIQGVDAETARQAALLDAQGRSIQEARLPFRSARGPRDIARIQQLALFRRLQTASLLERLRSPIDIPGLTGQIIDPQSVLGGQRLLPAPSTQRTTGTAREAGSRIRQEFRRFLGDERGTLTLPISTDLSRSPVLRAIRAIGRFFKQFNAESARTDAAASGTRLPRGPRGTYTRYNPTTGERVIGIRPTDPEFGWPNRPISTARRAPSPPPRQPVQVIDSRTGGIIYTTPQAAQAGGGGGAPPIIPRSTRGLPGGGGPGYNIKQGRSFGSAFNVLGSYAAAAFFIYGTIDAIREGISVAVQFEEEMLRLQGILRGKGLGDSLQISDAVISASTKYGASLREVLQLTTFLVQSGRPLNNLARDLDQIVGSITGLGISVDSARELIVAIRAITGGEVDVDIFDRIAVVQERAAVSAYDLAEGLKTTATIARELRGDYVGLITEIDLLGGAIGQVVTQTGVTGLQAATSLRNTISRLGRPEVIRTLQDVGEVKLGTVESDGRELRPIVEIFQELSRVYNQFKQEGRGAELQRLLVQLSGSRQTAALAAILQNFGKVTDTAKASALAFGDAQTRTNLVLEATGIQLRKVSESFKAIGISFVQSGFGSVLRGLLSGISGIFSAVASGGAAAELRITALVAGAIAASRVIRTLGSALYIALGAKSTAQILELTKAAGAGSFARNLYLRGAAVARSAASGTSVFARGLAAISRLLTPTGALLTGLALLIAGISTIYRLTRGKRNPLEVFQLDPSQLNNIVAPRLDQFRDFVEKLNELGARQAAAGGGAFQGVSQRGFFGQLRSTAEGILPTIDKEANRVQIVNAYTQALRNNSDVFGPWLDEQLKGLDDLDKQAKTIEIIMKILGEAAFVEGGVLQYGVRQLNKQIDEATTALQGLGGTLSSLSREGNVPTVARFGGGQFGVPTGDFGSLLKVLRSGQIDSTGRIAGLFELLANSIDQISKDTGSQTQSVRDIYQNKLREALLRSTDKVIDLVEGVGIFDQIVRQTIGGGVSGFRGTEQQVVDALTEELYRAARVNTDLANIAFKPPTGAEDIGAYSIGLIGRAQQQLLTRAFRETGGTALQQLIDILQGRGEGVRALVTSQAADRLTGVRNPITEFTQELFFTIKGLEYAEQAARTFGFSLEDTRQRTVSTLQTYAERLVALPLELYKQLADIRQRRAEQNIIVSRIDQEAGKGPLTDAQSAERENVNRQIQTYNEQEKRVLEQLKAIGLDERARNLLDVTRTLYTNLNLSTKDIDALVASFDANLGTDEALQNFFNSLVEFFIKGLEAGNRSIRELDIGPKLEAQLRSDINRQQIESRRTLFETISSGALSVSAVGRRPQATLNRRLQNIIAGSAFQGQLDTEQIRLQREQASLETDVKKRQELLQQADIDEKRLNTIRQITLETELQKEIYNDIYARQQQFEEQIQANLEDRLAGLRDVLADYDQFTKGGALRGIFGGAGQSFINRQITLLLDVFKPGGALGRVGELIGFAGEQQEDPITLAHRNGAEIVKASIIQGHLEGLAAAGFPIPAGAQAAATAGYLPGGIGAAYRAAEAAGLFNAPIEETPEQRAQRRAATLQGLGSVAGSFVGTAIGGGNTGARIGSQIGAAAGSFAPLPPGVGTFLGGVAGGLIGGLFGGGDDRPPPAVQALERIARNTGEQVTLLENTNKLLELQNIAFNVPSSFRLPSYGPAISAGQVTNEINVDISLGGTNVEASTLGAMVANAVASELESQYSTAGTYVSRIRY